MARREKKIKIDTKTYVVYELTTKQIRQILDAAGEISMDSANELLAMATDLTLADIEELAPSEIRGVWDAFAEVNADFLFVIRKMLKRPAVQRGIDQLIEKGLTDVFAALSSGGIPGPGTTDTDSFSHAFPNPDESTPG